MAVGHLRDDPDLFVVAQGIESALERQWKRDARVAEQQKARAAEIEKIDRIESNKSLKQAALDGRRGKQAKRFAMEFWGEHSESDFTLQEFRIQLAKKTRQWDAALRAQKARAPR